MRGLIRGFYRVFFKNRFVRWTWLLLLTVYAVYVVSEKLIERRAPIFEKSILKVETDDIAAFTIRAQNGDETTFSRGDSGWLAVHDDVTLLLNVDSLRPFFAVFSDLKSHTLRKLGESLGSEGKPQLSVDILLKNGNKSQFEVFYQAFDSTLNAPLTFVKLPNERLLHGVRADLLAIFNKDFDAYRNRQVLRFDPNAVVGLAFAAAADTLSLWRKDTLFVSKKRAVKWPQDSIKNLLSELSILRGLRFYDDSRELLLPRRVDNQSIIYFGQDSAVLTFYKLEKTFVMHSSQNADNYFRVDSLPNFVKSLTFWAKK